VALALALALASDKRYLSLLFKMLDLLSHGIFIPDGIYYLVNLVII
jgi:hypothetical protein